MGAVPQSSGVPAGWYTDPNGLGQRYWDGFDWTDQVAPVGSGAPTLHVPVPADNATAGSWIAGILASLILPIVGLILGAYYVTKKGTKKNVGITCLCLSGLVIVFYMVGAAASSGT